MKTNCEEIARDIYRKTAWRSDIEKELQWIIYVWQWPESHARQVLLDFSRKALELIKAGFSARQIQKNDMMREAVQDAGWSSSRTDNPLFLHLTKQFSAESAL